MGASGNIDIGATEGRASRTASVKFATSVSVKLSNNLL